ncbi:MAG: MazG nucleotide pyrophosphohydrolase domain-containing protein [Candidatus Wukongarchaeota archaeon]|nr:MazG nucleotide pyrophosphohydrolase domain-containing protein [Candidatus Wukongarchaeota archaeon]MDO8128070.1 MazG nucleotide pyrophosphohydrolase domain-containing protein [Candidatus Wukongarchaeota archaeon]
MKISDFQSLMLEIYGIRDRARGPERTMLWLVEEIGELAEAVREGNNSKLSEEFADVFAWLASLANVVNIDLETVALSKYGSGCPVCKSIPCKCAIK